MTVRPQSGRRWTYDDYAAIPPDLLRHEIIDGEHFVNPAPSLDHQQVLIRLLVQLNERVTEGGLGTVFCAPVDVQLTEHDVVQPDLVVVAEANREILTPPRIVGSPDWVIEILSPTTQRHDRRSKKELYARACVREYWMVDLESRSVEPHDLVDGEYRYRECAAARVNARQFPTVSIDLTRVW